VYFPDFHWFYKKIIMGLDRNPFKIDKKSILPLPNYSTQPKNSALLEHPDWS
jgi:hypothetical protein